MPCRGQSDLWVLWDSGGAIRGSRGPRAAHSGFSQAPFSLYLRWPPALILAAPGLQPNRGQWEFAMRAENTGGIRRGVDFPDSLPGFSHPVFLYADEMTVKWTARPCSRRGRTAVKSSPRRVSGVLAGAAPAHLCRCPGRGSRASSVSGPRGVLIPFGLQRPLLAWPVSGSHWAPHHRPGFLPPGRMEGLSRVSCLLLFYVDFGMGRQSQAFQKCGYSHSCDYPLLFVKKLGWLRNY